tara:strand:- start:248 stop:1981 length:1734 start_codon:yes stop_codon:yes gene_type:complete
VIRRLGDILQRIKGMPGQIVPTPARPLPSDLPRFANLTPERLAKAEQNRQAYLQRLRERGQTDTLNLASDINNFVTLEPGDPGFQTTDRAFKQPKLDPDTGAIVKRGAGETPPSEEEERPIGDFPPEQSETPGEPASGVPPATPPLDPTLFSNDMPRRDPVLVGQKSEEYDVDPLVRQLYFGDADTPGFINQLQQATRAAIQAGVPLEETAGLGGLEQTALLGAQEGIGSFQPYLQSYADAITEGVAAERGAAEMADPFFTEAQRQLGAGLGGLLGSFGLQGPSARDLQRASLFGFDPRSAGAFFNPFEEQVVQQTISDVLKRGEMDEIAQRAENIARGGESAFGSRAKLTAAERQSALARGLGEALAGIRAGGFESALDKAIRESEFSRRALQDAAAFESGLGTAEFGARGDVSRDLLNLGLQKTGLSRDIGRQLAAYGAQVGALGREQQELGQRERAELMSLGGIQRGLRQDELSRRFAQQRAQIDRPLGVLAATQQMLPQYKTGYTISVSDYAAPKDPVAGGLAAGIGAYTQFANPYQQALAVNQDRERTKPKDNEQDKPKGPIPVPGLTQGPA